MGEIVNLRSARKAKARASAEVVAAANPAKFGRTKGERATEAAEAERRTRVVDGARLQPEY